jgi:hypothetical protein
MRGYYSSIAPLPLAECQEAGVEDTAPSPQTSDHLSLLLTSSNVYKKILPVLAGADGRLLGGLKRRLT